MPLNFTKLFIYTQFVSDFSFIHVPYIITGIYFEIVTTLIQPNQLIFNWQVKSFMNLRATL